MSTPHSIAPALAALARLFEYPGAEAAARIATAQALLEPLADRRAAADNEGTPAAWLAGFATAFLSLPPEAREELYTATFDVSPPCVPYVSVHLFGEENFKRAELMAALNSRYAATGFDAAGELPDHLSVLLRFAGQTDEAERSQLARFCLLGPLDKMIGSLPAGNPYHALLRAVRATFEAGYPGLEPAPSPLQQQRPGGGGCGCGDRLEPAHRPGFTARAPDRFVSPSEPALTS